MMYEIVFSLRGVMRDSLEPIVSRYAKSVSYERSVSREWDREIRKRKAHIDRVSPEHLSIPYSIPPAHLSRMSREREEMAI